MRDTGVGVPPEHQRIIFEAFRQGDGSTHRRFGGSGLGLSISRDLADFPLPLALVVHIPRERPSRLAEALGNRCALTVRDAEDKEPLVAGTVFLAPAGYHLLVDLGPTLALSVEEPVNLSIPSIDVLFESAACELGDRVIGVLLTGASEDGARGLAAIHQAGGVTIVQSPHEAQVPIMPSAGLRRCPGARSMTLGELASYLVELRPPCP